MEALPNKQRLGKSTATPFVGRCCRSLRRQATVARIACKSSEIVSRLVLPSGPGEGRSASREHAVPGRSTRSNVSGRFERFCRENFNDGCAGSMTTKTNALTPHRRPKMRRRSCLGAIVPISRSIGRSIVSGALPPHSGGRRRRECCRPMSRHHFDQAANACEPQEREASQEPVPGAGAGRFCERPETWS